MLLQTNSYVVPKDKRTEHSRLLNRFRQTLARLGCESFEVYEETGANWTSESTGRFVQIMRFRDRKQQLVVQAAERTDPQAQALIREFCELINFPYQQQQGLFAVGYYNSVLPVRVDRPPETRVPAVQVMPQLPAVQEQSAEAAPPPLPVEMPVTDVQPPAEEAAPSRDADSPHLDEQAIEQALEEQHPESEMPQESDATSAAPPENQEEPAPEPELLDAELPSPMDEADPAVDAEVSDQPLEVDPLASESAGEPMNRVDDLPPGEHPLSEGNGQPAPEQERQPHNQPQDHR